MSYLFSLGGHAAGISLPTVAKSGATESCMCSARFSTLSRTVGTQEERVPFMARVGVSCAVVGVWSAEGRVWLISCHAGDLAPQYLMGNCSGDPPVWGVSWDKTEPLCVQEQSVDWQERSGCSASGQCRVATAVSFL
eukprot:5511138-Amphidinium_carterae.1